MLRESIHVMANRYSALSYSVAKLGEELGRYWMFHGINECCHLFAIDVPGTIASSTLAQLFPNWATSGYTYAKHSYRAVAH